ncbi:hypothetical protein A8B75_13250 [Sphingomonadales bacterium EhC05]|nr:hypothetical protein A8B75_13250 [Sphingomonadales bacterium EhC05]
MTLHRMQKLQIIWVILGLSYNVVSYWRLTEGKSQLAPTSPVAGAIFMAICGVVILAGLIGAQRISKFIIPVLTLFLIYSGVFLHINAYWENTNLPDYASKLPWFAAILINIYGVATLILGSWLAFRPFPEK